MSSNRNDNGTFASKLVEVTGLHLTKARGSYLISGLLVAISYSLTFPVGPLAAAFKTLGWCMVIGLSVSITGHFLITNQYVSRRLLDLVNLPVSFICFLAMLALTLYAAITQSMAISEEIFRIISIFLLSLCIITASLIGKQERGLAIFFGVLLIVMIILKVLRL